MKITWMKSIGRLDGTMLLLVGLFLLQSATAQTAAPAEPLSLKQVEAQSEAVKRDASLEDSLRQSILQNLQQVSENLKRTDEFKEATAEYERQLQQAPSAIALIKQELAVPVVDVTLAADASKSLAVWEQELLKANADVDAARQKLAELEAEVKKRTVRRGELPELLSAATARNSELTDKLSLPAGHANDSPLLSLSSRWVLLSDRQMRDAEIASYNTELQGYDSYRELLTARRDRAARKLGTAESLATALQKWVNQQRHIESEVAAAKANEARRDALQLEPVIQAIADRNAVLAELRTGDGGLTSRLRRATKELQDAKDLTTAIKSRAGELKERIDAAGLTHAVAQLLRRERDNLPDVRRYRPRIRLRRDEIANVQLDLLDFNSERSQLLDIGNKVAALSNVPGKTEQERAELAVLLTGYLTAQREQLDTLITENNTYFSVLVDLDTAERHLVESVASLSKAIAEHILWVRSDTVFGPQTFKQAGEGIVWLADPAHAQEVGQTLFISTKQHPLTLFVLLLSEVLLGLYYVFAGRRLRSMATKTSRIRSDRFIYTIEALLHTTLRAVPVPLALFLIGWQLTRSGSSEALFATAVGAAFLRTSLVLFAHLLLYEACVSKGLIESHFGWKHPVTQRLRKALLRLMLAAMPLLWLATLLANCIEESETKSLERLLFLAIHLVLIGFALLLLRRKSEFVVQLSSEMRDHSLLRSRRLILTLTIFLSSVIMAADVLGYYYTAEQIANWFTRSIVLVLGILLLEAMLMRGLRIVARRVEFELRVKERQEMLRQKDSATESAGETLLEEEELDVVAISESTRRLLRVSSGFALLFGMGFIWADVVPALNLFDRIVLWTVQTESHLPGGQMLPVPISLADLFSAIIVAMITVVAARNLPGLLELAVLRNLRIAYGERYAISTIIRYVTVATGIALTFSMLGIGWSKIRWLVAALSVGLGFGLQEIFANFISGLILLFERPIRVRDFVTVGGTSGQVSRIQIRATTITDFDNKELLIPNKQFVTGELVNWTLTNSVMRIVVPVGIAYGSDTKKAAKILLDIAKNYRLAVTDPAPSAFFAEFGESSLNFELRVFISQAEKFREALHELHMAVDDAFRKAGIEIAFPQRDLHLRSVSPTIHREDIIPPNQTP